MPHFCAFYIFYIEYVVTVHIVVPATLNLVVMISGFEETSVQSVKAIAESIRGLGIITCDVCKTAKASHDVFVQGTGEVAFLRRCCEQCVKSFSGSQSR